VIPDFRLSDTTIHHPGRAAKERESARVRADPVGEALREGVKVASAQV
jgi:hypothetical protein